MNSGVKAVVFLSKYGQRVRSNIVQHEGHMGSEKHARLATAVAHLDYDDVSPYRELTGRVTSITTNKQRTASRREMEKPDTSSCSAGCPGLFIDWQQTRAQV